MSHFYIVCFKCVSTQLASPEKWFEQFLVLLKKVSESPLEHQVKVTGEVDCIQDRAVHSAPGFTRWQWGMVFFSQPWPESFTGINIFCWARSSFYTPMLIRRDVYPSSVSLVFKKFCIWQVLNSPTLAHNAMKFLCGYVCVCVLTKLIMLHSGWGFYCVLSAEHAVRAPMGLREESTLHFPIP